MRRLALLAFGVVACGGSAPPPAPVPPPAPAPVAVPASVPAGTLRRADVNAVIDAGFARFLQTLDVEPSLDSGRFRGWTIVELRSEELFGGVDLKEGDVVTSVNGLPIERETEAFNAFESLRGAEQITVAYARAGTSRTLSYRIVP
jgi:type II secretory pathway component PulC